MTLALKLFFFEIRLNDWSVSNFCFSGLKSCLLIVDVQNCFLPGGSLPLPNGDQVKLKISKVIKHVKTFLWTWKYLDFDQKNLIVISNNRFIVIFTWLKNYFYVKSNNKIQIEYNKPVWHFKTYILNFINKTFSKK